MARKRIKGTKYCRVTPQQKFIFLKLCITEKQSIHQAAYHSGIHYSTAKTILFFHKKQYKNYTSYFVNEPLITKQKTQLKMVQWKIIPIDVDGNPTEKNKIEVIVNSKMLNKKHMRHGLENNTGENVNQNYMLKMQQDQGVSFKYHLKRQDLDSKQINPLNFDFTLVDHQI